MKTYFLSLIIILSLNARAESPWGSPSVWDQAQLPPVSAKDITAPGFSELTESLQQDLLSLCRQRGSQTKSFKVDRGMNTYYKFSEVSPLEEAQKECLGRVGESFCKAAQQKASLNACISEQLTLARLAKSL